MTKVKSISIEGGAANPIADKGLDEALAETTMAATDSIPVKKAGGGFVYLDKNSLVSAVCQAFGIPAKNNNIGTALTHILGFNSGNGAGVATLAEAAQVLGVTPPANVVRKVTFGSTGPEPRYVYVGRMDYSAESDSYMSFFIDGFSNYGSIGRNRGFITFGTRGTATMNKVLLETAESMSFGYVRNGDYFDFYMSTNGVWICTSIVVELIVTTGVFIMQEIGAFPDNITLFQ